MNTWKCTCSFFPSPLIAPEISLYIHKQQPNCLNIKARESLTTEVDRDQEGKPGIINQPPVLLEPTHDPAAMWRTEFSTLTPSFQKPDHNNQALVIPQGKCTCSVYLIERKGWQRYKQKKKQCSEYFVFVNVQLALSLTFGIEMGLTGGWGRIECCWKERGMLRMKVRQTTQNSSLLNFNLLDKNNSKWGTEYAWGREGILSFSGDSSLNGIANYVSHRSVQFS